MPSIPLHEITNKMYQDQYINYLPVDKPKKTTQLLGESSYGYNPG